MPRQRRVIPDGSVQHVLNRGNRRAKIFHQTADYECFTNLLADTAEHIPMRLLAFCVMPNHWHLVVWVDKGEALSAYIQRLATSHVHQHHHAYRTTGLGHVYQGRFRNFTVQEEGYLYQVLRYVEANPLSANLVKRAEDWRWSSLTSRTSADGRPLLAVWPVPTPRDWREYVNRGIPGDELRQLRQSARRGTPYGSGEWVAQTVAAYGLEATVTPPGRRVRESQESHLSRQEL